MPKAALALRRKTVVNKPESAIAFLEDTSEHSSPAITQIKHLTAFEW